MNTAYHIAIIGGGASGALLALHLRQKNRRCRIVVIERSQHLGRGVAYSTDRSIHLLNTRAGDMSAWPDQPAHFAQWLEHHQPNGSREFIPRSLFGDYLNGLFLEAVSMSEGALSAIGGEVFAVQSDEGSWRIDLVDGIQLYAAHVVLATGHNPLSGDHGLCRGNPWVETCLEALPEEAGVLLLGTGLTTVDVIASLLERGHRGRITALSRRGLLPRVHRTVEHCEAEITSLFVGPLSQRLRAFRLLQRGGSDWQSLMHAIRPHNAAIWHGLDDVQRRRFLRHLRPWWDVHRHRMAPEIAVMMNDALGSGQLAVQAARLEACEAGSAEVSVQFRPRRSRQSEVRSFARVIDCRGSDCGVTELNPLIASLARAGVVVADQFDLGLAVDSEDRAIGLDGKASEFLSILGPPTRGQHWESTAIPDIRRRAARLAERLNAVVSTA